MHPESLQKIISYLIGSPAYKEAHYETFREALLNVDIKATEKILAKTQLHGVFHFEVLKYPDLGKDFAEMSLPYVRYHSFLASLYQTELDHLSGATQKTAIAPVIIKGGSYYPYYKNAAERFFTDIDILIQEKDSLKSLCILLERVGYKSQYENYNTLLNDTENYNVGNFYFNIQLKNVEEKLRKDLEYLIGIKYTDTLWQEDNGCFVQRLDLDLHKTLFIKSDYVFPKVDAKDITDFKSNGTTLQTLNKAVNLAYLSCKFFNDVDLHVNKKATGYERCIRLLGDFIKIVTSADQNDINRSIRISEEWGTVGHYKSILQHIQYLVPELDFSEVEPLKEPQGMVGSLINAIQIESHETSKTV